MNAEVATPKTRKRPTRRRPTNAEHAAEVARLQTEIADLRTQLALRRWWQFWKPS